MQSESQENVSVDTSASDVMYNEFSYIMDFNKAIFH